MAQLAALRLRLVDPAWTGEVPAPAHDSLTPDERRRYVADHPDSYLAVTRSPEDLTPGKVWDPERGLAASRRALARLIERGAFSPEHEPGLYLYRLANGHHEQVGVVGGVATSDYDRGLIRVHEQVRPVRVEHLRSQMAGVAVQSSPIAVAYRDNSAVAAALATTRDRADPLVDFTSADGVHQQVWAVPAGPEAELKAALADQPLYLVDGHHRAAATSALVAGGLAPASWMLGVAFSASDLRNQAFHRVLPGVDGQDLLDRLPSGLAVRAAPDAEAVLARGDNEVAVLTLSERGDPRWHLVQVPADKGLLDQLEPVRLQRHILEPVLGPQGLTGVEFRSGQADRTDLEALAASATAPVWVMRPVPIDQIMAVSDAGLVMPPKSTYFSPKVRSGIFLRTLD